MGWESNERMLSVSARIELLLLIRRRFPFLIHIHMHDMEVALFVVFKFYPALIETEECSRPIMNEVSQLSTSVRCVETGRERDSHLDDLLE